MGWCLYGVVQGGIWVHPYLFGIYAMTDSAYDYIYETDRWGDTTDIVDQEISWNASDPRQIISLWWRVAVIALGILVAFTLFHYFAAWIWGENERSIIKNMDRSQIEWRNWMIKRIESIEAKLNPDKDSKETDNEN